MCNFIEVMETPPGKTAPKWVREASVGLFLEVVSEEEVKESGRTFILCHPDNEGGYVVKRSTLINALLSKSRCRISLDEAVRARMAANYWSWLTTEGHVIFGEKFCRVVEIKERRNGS